MCFFSLGTYCARSSFFANRNLVLLHLTEIWVLAFAINSSQFLFALKGLIKPVSPLAGGQSLNSPKLG